MRTKSKPVAEAAKTTTLREIAAINQEYAALCGQAGDMQFKIHSLPGELQSINVRLSQLRSEYAAREAWDRAHPPAAPTQPK